VFGYFYLESFKRANNTKEIINAYKNAYEKVDSIDNNALDLLLSCGDYSYFENESTPLKSYFRIPYNGCLYNPSVSPDNELGWADVIIIPRNDYKKEFLSIKGDNIDLIEATLKKMPISELKIKFEPIVFLIEKKYLHYSKNAEINYYPKLPYLKKMFVYEDEFKKWELVDFIEIHSESEDGKWVDEKIIEML